MREPAPRTRPPIRSAHGGVRQRRASLLEVIAVGCTRLLTQCCSCAPRSQSWRLPSVGFDRARAFRPSAVGLALRSNDSTVVASGQALCPATT
jgi:hypothetical protein